MHSDRNNIILNMIPDVTPDELMYITTLTKDYSVEQLQQFAIIFRTKRKDPQMILLTCLLGLVCFAGIHRFLIGQIGMGILYFFTGGLCLIGTIVDAINHKKLAFEYNREMIAESIALIRMQQQTMF
jgi:TM2 domain-containing membrane protein YozV